MEFKRREEWSQFYPDTFPPEFHISREEAKMALANEYLHDQHSHFVVSAEGEYDDTRAFIYGTIPERIAHLSNCYKEGKTIVVKEMENWNEKIIEQCKLLPRYTDVHMYFSPAGATGFGWHTDDKDVHVHMQYGEKHFEVEEPDGTISKYLLKAGDVLYIPYGARHRAYAGDRPSVHLGFGVWPQKLTIKEEYETLDLKQIFEFPEYLFDD